MNVSEALRIYADYLDDTSLGQDLPCTGSTLVGLRTNHGFLIPDECGYLGTEGSMLGTIEEVEGGCDCDDDLYSLFDDEDEEEDPDARQDLLDDLRADDDEFALTLTFRC